MLALPDVVGLALLLRLRNGRNAEDCSRRVGTGECVSSAGSACDLVWEESG